MSPYPKTLSLEIRAEIQEYTTKMKDMKGGDSFSIISPSHSIRMIESWLRSWLSVEGYPRGTYRISKESPTTIRVLKRYGTEGKVIKDSTEKETAFVIDHLLEIKTEEEALAILQAARKEGKLGAKQFLRALEEWRRVIGKEED